MVSRSNFPQLRNVNFFCNLFTERFLQKRSRFEEKKFFLKFFFAIWKVSFESWEEQFVKLLTSHYATFSHFHQSASYVLRNKVFWRQLHLVETYGKIEISALEYCGVPYWVEKIGEWCRFCRLKLQNIGLRGLFSLQFENWMLTNLFSYRVFHTTMSVT